MALNKFIIIFFFSPSAVNSRG